MPVRIGVIGVGAYAQRAHLPQLARHPDAVLHAFCRRNPVRLAEVANQYKVPRRYTDIEQALADPELDAVTISLPHNQHYPVARAALVRGLHVMVDKPMTLTTAEARDLIGLARAQQRVLMVGFNRHYEPPFTRAKPELEAGAIGQPRLIDCYIAYDWDYWRVTGEAAQVLSHDDLPFEGSHVENFVDVILGRAAPRATAQDGLRQVAVTEAAYRSAREGRPIEL